MDKKDEVRKLKIVEYLDCEQPCVLDDDEKPARLKLVDFVVEKKKFSENKRVFLKAACSEGVSLNVKGVDIMIDKKGVTVVDGEEGKHEYLIIEFLRD